MAEAIGWGVAIVWLAMGGWAYVKIDTKGASHDQLAALATVCIVLAPFAFGCALAQQLSKAKEGGE